MTLAEQRLNSNHGRLLRAARSVPAQLRHTTIPGLTWTARDLLAHVLAWQEEALRRFGDPHSRSLTRTEVEQWDRAAQERYLALDWEVVVDRLEAVHEARRARVRDSEPPPWFAACTYRHYTDHTRTLRGLSERAA